MSILLDPWIYSTKDSSCAIWRGVVHGFFVGASEGIIIYFIMKSFGIFSTLSIYG